jgi:hypothetical protein
MLMRNVIILVLLPLVLAGCATLAPADVAAATLYFPPQVKRIDEPRFCFSPVERERALQEYRQRGADTLFELVIDAQGKVKRARLVRTHVDREYRQSMVDHAYKFGFTADPQGQGYRAFYFPMKYSHETQFDWVEPG